MLESIYVVRCDLLLMGCSIFTQAYGSLVSESNYSTQQITARASNETQRLYTKFPYMGGNVSKQDKPGSVGEGRGSQVFKPLYLLSFPLKDSEFDQGAMTRHKPMV